MTQTILPKTRLQSDMEQPRSVRKRASLDTLTEEILFMVLSYGYVKTTRKLPFPTLASVLSRINRQLRLLVRKYALRSIHINGSTRLRKFEQFLLDRPSLADMVW